MYECLSVWFLVTINLLTPRFSDFLIYCYKYIKLQVKIQVTYNFYAYWNPKTKILDVRKIKNNPKKEKNECSINFNTAKCGKTSIHGTCARPNVTNYCRWRTANVCGDPYSLPDWAFVFSLDLYKVFSSVTRFGVVSFSANKSLFIFLNYCSTIGKTLKTKYSC